MNYYTIAKADAVISLAKLGSAKLPYLVTVKWNSGSTLARYFETYDLAADYARSL